MVNLFLTTERQLAHSPLRLQEGISEDGKQEEIIIQCAFQGLTKHWPELTFSLNVGALCK